MNGTLDPGVPGEALEPRVPESPPGVRVVLDVRPLQDPDRAPTTAAYLDALLAAYDAEPLAGESFALLLQSDLDDPTQHLERLDVIGRRLLPPTRLLRLAAQVVDPFVLSGASLGAAWRAERGGAAGGVYHAAAGGLPALTGIPTVVTLLDLAPWELPDQFGRGPVARVGLGLRTGLIRHADAVIVTSAATAATAHTLLRIPRGRLHVVPLAPRPAFRLATEEALDDPEDPERGLARSAQEERERLGLPERYLVYSGRYDARHDLPTLFEALARLAAANRPEGLPAEVVWPPRILLLGAAPDDRAAVARSALRWGVADSIAYAPRLPDDRLAVLVRGARAAVLPVLSEAAGLAAIEAIAVGTPLVASAVGPLPELIAGAGLLVPPREVDRLAVALSTAWSDEAVHGGIAAAAARLARGWTRTWADVAAETRAVYADVATST